MSTSNQFKKSSIALNHHGRTYSLYLRGDNPNLYLRLTRSGRQINRSLGTPHKATAVAKAVKVLKELEKRDWVPEVKLHTPVARDYATLGALVDCYLSSRQPIAAATMRDYTNALLKVVRVGAGRSDARGLSSILLSEATLDKFIELSRKEGRPDHSIKSTVIQARAMLSPSVMSIYRDLLLPDLTGFRAARKYEVDEGAGFLKFTRQEVIDLEALAAQLLSQRKPVWIAYALMSQLALRNKEVARARWSDVSEGVEFVDGKPVSMRYLRVRADYAEAKAATIVLSDALWADLQHFVPTQCTHPVALGKDGQPIPCDQCDHIVPAANKTERLEITEREINDTFRHLITGRRKISYELRRWAGSRIYTKYGSDAARDTLRHASVVTVTKYYATELKGARSAGAEDLREIYGLN